jgi:hypothetical protein
MLTSAMPPVPTVIMLPNDRNDGYYPASVIAALPLGHGNTYIVTAIKPTSSPLAPVFLVSEASRSIHGFWTASGGACETALLAEALADLTREAGLARTEH